MGDEPLDAPGVALFDDVDSTNEALPQPAAVAQCWRKN
jgi:hypothetical protein